MIFLKKAKMPGHIYDHIMAKTSGSKDFSHILDAVRILARPKDGGSSVFLQGDYEDPDEEEPRHRDKPSEAFSLKHLSFHKPYNPFCKACVHAK